MDLTKSWAPQIKTSLGGEWSRPLCNGPQVGSSRELKPVVMWWLERVLPLKTSILSAYYQLK